MRFLLFFFIVFICKKGNGSLYQCNENAACGCSFKFTLISRIIGGENAVEQSWSWAVSLRSTEGHFCGGAILSPSFIITAAHCFNDKTNLKSITILAGSVNLKPSSKDSPQIRSIARIYKHPNYNPITYENDLTLIRLSIPLDMGHGNIKPICLPSGTVPQPSNNMSMVAVGWGTTSTSIVVASPTLQQVTVKSIASTYSGCKEMVADSKLQFCAGIITGGKDTCQGDSGGPLMAFVNNVWQLHGITSNGYGCALPGYPGIYTRVSYYVKWIQSIMSPNKITTISPITTRMPTTTKHITSKRLTTTMFHTQRRPIGSMTTVQRSFNMNKDSHEQT
ncbi:unnamed protein product [Rotaria sp. Silwood2]|nr:unnamed protein product [Rotaria sp. Silwood2]CAF4510960.1 unnamed protein product [Rotaria sp. Silwood2]